MHNRFGCLSFFLRRFALVWFITHDASRLFLIYGRDRRSAGDVMGHKCAGLFDIVYWCVLCLRARMQHTIEISTHIMRAHNMPCHHHHQDAHQQETTHTPPKVPFKCHHNIRKIARKHNITHACPNAVKTHLRNNDWYTAGFAPTHHRHSDPQDTLKSSLTHHHPQPRHNKKPTLHNSMTNVTDHKGSAQTCRLYISTAWAQGDAATTQHGVNIAQREPQVRSA